MNPREHAESMLKLAKGKLNRAKKRADQFVSPRFMSSLNDTLDSEVKIAEAEVKKWQDRLAKLPG